MADRYVVSIRMTGLGDRIVCLCAAWLFAHSTGRVLVADWRYGADMQAGSGSIFPHCFEPVREIAGVPFIGDNLMARALLPPPRHPPLWDDDRVMTWPFLRPPGTVTEDRDAAVALIRSGQDVDAHTVVFDTCVNDGVWSRGDAHRFLCGLKPVASVQAMVDAFQAAYLRPEPMIGLHMRHGNGGDIMGHAPYWDSFEDAIARCCRAIDLARARLGSEAPVFLCTDSADVQLAIRDRVPGVICRDKRFRESGEGELHFGRHAALGRDDALTEMLLLAKCDVLIRYPPGSFFSFYAAVMKSSHTAPPDTVYDLQIPGDPADPLAPALLF